MVVWRAHQAVTPQQHVEAVAPGHETGAEQGAEHYPKLVTADAGVLMTDFLHVGDDDTLASRFFHDVGFQLVESLAAMAKTLTSSVTVWPQVFFGWEC